MMIKYTFTSASVRVDTQSSKLMCACDQTLVKVCYLQCYPCRRLEVQSSLSEELAQSWRVSMLACKYVSIYYISHNTIHFIKWINRVFNNLPTEERCSLNFKGAKTLNNGVQRITLKCKNISRTIYFQPRNFKLVRFQYTRTSYVNK